MKIKPSLTPVPDNTYGRPKHPLRMPGYLQDRITLAILGMFLAIVALIVGFGFLTFAFVEAKRQQLPPIQGAIQLPNGVILNQDILLDADASDAAFRAAVRDHVYRWRSVTSDLTLEQQWKGMVFRVSGDAATMLFGTLKNPDTKPGKVLAEGLIRCTDTPTEMTVYPSAGKPGWYEINWYEVTLRAGTPCTANLLRDPKNMRWGEFNVEIDPAPTAEKKRWNLMGITITDYRTDVID